MSNFDFFYLMSVLIPLALIGMVVLLYLYRNRLKWKKTIYLIIWNALLSLCLLSVIYGIGETYYRFFVDTTDSFGVNKISQRWNKRYYQLNSTNNRDDIDYKDKIKKGKRRLTILGDSFTAGHGIKNINDRFGNILRNKYPGFEVHLIAVNGANSISQLKFLHKAKENGYELDFVMLAYCLNDIDYLIEGTEKIYERIRAFNINLSYIEKNSYFINTLSFRIFALNDPDFIKYSNYVSKGYSGEVWEEQKEILTSIRNIVNQMNGSFFVMTFPFLQEERDDYSFRKIHENLNAFWGKEQVPHLDLLPIYEPFFGGELTVNDYDAHPNERAHEMAATAIDNFLQSMARSARK